MDKKICIFTQTYSDNRKVLYDYHNLDEQDIKFRNNFDNLYVFHNCSDEYINTLKNTHYLQSIKNINYVIYNDISYTESFKKTIELLESLNYNYLMFIQDDVFSDVYPNMDKLINFIKNEDFMMLNLETELNRTDKIFYQDDDFIVYDTNSLDFSTSLDYTHTYSKDDIYYCWFDDGPYIANIDYVKEHIYDDTYYAIGNIQVAERYLIDNKGFPPIQRLTMNKYFYRRRNILGPFLIIRPELADKEINYLEKRFKNYLYNN